MEYSKLFKVSLGKDWDSTFRNFHEFLGMMTWKSQHWLATYFSTLCYYVDLKLTKTRRPRLSMFWQLSRLSRQTKVRPWPRSSSRVLLAYSWLIKKNSTLSWKLKPRYLPCRASNKEGPCRFGRAGGGRDRSSLTKIENRFFLKLSFLPNTISMKRTTGWFN